MSFSLNYYRYFPKKIWLKILCFWVATFFYTTTTAQNKQVLKKIIIDAGHGGKDIGARGRYSTEKDVSLSIALALEEKIKQEIPDVEVYMTRTTDVFDNPIVKANKANDAKGDLFISIHCNSAPPRYHREFVGYKTQTYTKGKGAKKKTYTRKVKQYRTWTSPNLVHGTETFIWNINKTNAKEEALKNHEDIYLDSASLQALHDFEKNDPEKMILYALKSKQFFDRSASLALAVEEEFIKIGRNSRQAQQRSKGIWVLQAVAMPAILVETGFISNPQEEDYLNSTAGREEIAQVITNAIKKYRNSLSPKNNKLRS